jgi:hypothetical protein
MRPFIYFPSFPLSLPPFLLLTLLRSHVLCKFVSSLFLSCPFSLLYSFSPIFLLSYIPFPLLCLSLHANNPPPPFWFFALILFFVRLVHARFNTRRIRAGGYARRKGDNWNTRKNLGEIKNLTSALRKASVFERRIY